MPPIETILSVALAGLALSITPGPSMLYVLSRSIGQSRAAGLASALGLALGGVLLAVATALGLATLFAVFDWIVPTLRIAGSFYLGWLGVDLIRGARATASMSVETEPVLTLPFSQIVRQGVLIEILNPKTVLFFALFLPPFVSTDGLQAGLLDVKLQLLILGSLVPLTALPSDVLVAYLGGTAAEAIRRNEQIRLVLAWIAGTTLIAIAVNLFIGII